MMNNQFSENLKKIRKENNLSQEQLADELGVSRQAISKWESAVAYPEMEKIIALCNKFHLNIDDLLYKDIKEIKGEEEAKKKLNHLLEDFLNFITDSINLFSSMTFKSKIKCLLEQMIIIVILFIVSRMILSILSPLLIGVLSILPMNIDVLFRNIFQFIFNIFYVILSIIIITHIFKTRYLDYYNQVKVNDSNHNETNVDFTHSLKKENKIIIRDPKHSEYKFINGLFKLIIGGIKFFFLWIALWDAFCLIGLFCLLVLSFLIYKTGIFFIGSVIVILAMAMITMIILLLILNFLFNRKNNKKKIIWSFILSLIGLGVGMGFIGVGSLNFEILDYDEDMLKVVTKEHDMADSLIIQPYHNLEINYIESDIDNVKVEYVINKLCDVEEYNHDGNNISAWTSCRNPIGLVKEFIKNINHKKLIFIDDDIKQVSVYANSANIEIIKNNWNIYISDSNDFYNEVTHYENEISDLQIENDKLREKVDDLQREIDALEQNKE